MRDIAPNLLSAQNFEQTIGGKTGKRMPYAELIFYSSAGGVPLDYSTRNKGIIQWEYPYEGGGKILLNNNDHQVDWMLGYYIEIKMGDYFFNDSGVKTGSLSKHLPRLWVVGQQDVSFPGAKFVELELADSWRLLTEKPCIIEDLNDLAPYHYARFGDGFPSATLDYIIGRCLNSAGWGPEPMSESDGIIDGYLATDFYINGHYLDQSYISEDYKGYFESYKEVIQRALSRTFMYLRIRGGVPEGPLFQYVYPQEDDEVDETYYSYKAHWFYKFVYRKNLAMPNRILTYCDYDFENKQFFGFPDSILIGQADNLESQAEIGLVRVPVWIPEVRDQVNADSIAEAYLSREVLKSRGGRLIIPHDIRVELYDKVEVFDTR